MNRLKRVCICSLLFLFMFSAVVSAASQTITDTGGKLVMEGTQQGNQVTLSLWYKDLAADFTGLSLQIEMPPALNVKNAKFESDNSVIKTSAVHNYDDTVDLFKLLILSPTLSTNPQGKNGKIGDLTFSIRDGQMVESMNFLFKIIRVYGGGEQIIVKQDIPLTFTFDMKGPQVVDAVLEDAKTISVIFDEPVAAETAVNAAQHFKVVKQSDNHSTVKVDSAVLSQNKLSATIQLAAALETNVSYLLEVSGVEDLLGNVMKAPYSKPLMIEDHQAPTPVTGLTAVDTTSHSIGIRWNANTEADLAGYSIFVDGVLKDTVTDNHYIATGLKENTEVVLGVQAVDRYGNLAELVSVTGKTQPGNTDITGPEVTTVKVKDPQTLLISFNEAVAEDTAQLTGGSFTIARASDPNQTVTISSIKLQSQNTAAELQLATALEKNTDYTLTVDQVKDAHGNKMATAYHVNLKLVDTPSGGDTVLLLERSVDIAEPGEAFTLKIRADAKDLYGFDIALTYDAKLVELVSPPLLHAEFGSAEQAMLMHTDRNGLLRMVGTRLGQVSGVSGSVGLVELRFKAKEQASGLNAFTITTATELSNFNTVIQKVDREVQSQVAVSSPDVNGGGLAVNDLTEVARALGKRVGDKGYEQRLDMNKDGIINILDISYVAYKLLN